MRTRSGWHRSRIPTARRCPARALQRRSERLLRRQQRSLVQLTAAEPEALRSLLPQLFAEETRAAGCLWVEGLCEGAEQAWPDLLLRLNERRDALGRHLSGG